MGDPQGSAKPTTKFTGNPNKDFDRWGYQVSDKTYWTASKPGGEPERVDQNRHSAQELFFQLIGLLGVSLDVSPVGMVELFVHGASLTT